VGGRRASAVPEPRRHRLPVLRDADGGGLEPAQHVAFTGLLLRLLRAAHPPAGATTVIVSLGLLDTPEQMAALAIGVLLVAIPAGIINRLCGVPAPLWMKPYQGLGNLLRPGSEPPKPDVPFAGGLLDQWRSQPPVQGSGPPPPRQ
jgi:hypothetical protein